MRVLGASGKYDCIMATSYFSINPELFPVSLFPNELLIDMNSMDFEEYLWANGLTDNTLEELRLIMKKTKTVVPNIITSNDDRIYSKST